MRTAVRRIGAVAVGGALLVGLVSCEGTKTSVGSGLLGSIEGQHTRHDTLTFSLTDPQVISIASYPVLTHASDSRILLVGEANNYRATTLLKFPQLEEFKEDNDYYDGEAWQTETKTITPYEVAGDSLIELRLTFGGFVTDPGDLLLEGWRIPSGWTATDSITTAMPADWFTSTPAFYGDTLAADSTGSGSSSTLTYIPIDSAAASTMLDDSLCFAVRLINPTTMAQMYSRESEVVVPHFVVTYRARVVSNVNTTERDTVITTTYTTSADCYRLERLAGYVTPATGTLLVGSGAPERSYLKIDRFNIPDMSDTTTGRMDTLATANKAILELTLGSVQNTFQSDSLHLEILELSEPFEADSAIAGDLSFLSSRLNYTSYFDTDENRDSTDSNIRTFEIADMVNRWWRSPDTNYGILITSGVELLEGDEQRRVDAAEIIGARLFITTTRPPLLGDKPSREAE